MGGTVMSRLIIVGAGLIYPAYSSYKAIKSADIRQYIRWIMYWIVFALFTSAETITDVFLSWLPFYYELKVLFVLWLSLPYTKGSRFLYKKLIHPNLSKREQEIDFFLESARERSYKTVIRIGSKSIHLAANAVVAAAVKGQTVVSNRLRSYSSADLTSIRDSTPTHRHPAVARMKSSPALIREVSLMSNASKPNNERTGHIGTEQRPPSVNLPYSTITTFNEMEDIRKTDAVDERRLSADDVTYENICYTVDDLKIVEKRSCSQEDVMIGDDWSRQYFTMPVLRKMPPMPSIDET